MNLIWKKHFFSGLYTIYDSGKEVGTLKENHFSQAVQGTLYGKSFTFKTRGVFKQDTEIIEAATQKVIGMITYDSFWTKATVLVNEKMAFWKYDNLWGTKWSLIYEQGSIIKYTGSSTSGQIDSDINDPLMLLTGLFITNYYWQLLMAIFIVLFVIIIT